ncbi:MAG: YlmH/Sll1252 family protein [Lachnospiraceae bacterium]|nr:YlmH/Sll1252 family protein [Lachnospiraceae bacterium]
MTEQELTAARFCDLSRRAYDNNYVTHTDFLTGAEQSLLQELQMGRIADRRLAPAAVVLLGGWDEADRKVACFLPDYEDPASFPMEELAAMSRGEGIITCLRIAPLQKQFADSLTHRDYLGALMNLGIERSLIGDILVDRASAEAVIFVMSDMASVVTQELTRVKHTSVSVSAADPAAVDIRPEFEERTGSVASERLDAVVAFAYRLARGKAQKLIEAEHVLVGGRPVLSGGSQLKPGDRVTVKGFGKFIFDGIEHETKKGRLMVRIRLFR